MKKLLYATLLSFISSSSHAQTQGTYELAMNKFMNYFNKNQGDSIGNMFGSGQSIFNQGSVESMRKHYGKIRFFQYMGIDPSDSVRLFKIVLVKLTEPKVTGILLDKDDKVTALHFFTSSPYIDSLLKQFP